MSATLSTADVVALVTAISATITALLTVYYRWKFGRTLADDVPERDAAS